MMAPISLQVDPVLSHAVGAALAVVLLSGAWQKLKEQEAFAAALENYRLLPAAMVGWMARLLPPTEALA
ncbi:MAG: MauE/DoxX family redox-associated membrane protein, partial [Sulfuritalea sp.]|nr:MauE/DoxX family redox-associated membrane protein [Sulfuritalea sp.]